MAKMYEAISYFLAGRVLIGSLSKFMGESLLAQVDQLSGVKSIRG
jgi:hypothetical protein